MTAVMNVIFLLHVEVMQRVKLPDVVNDAGGAEKEWRVELGAVCGNLVEQGSFLITGG